MKEFKNYGESRGKWRLYYCELLFTIYKIIFKLEPVFLPLHLDFQETLLLKAVLAV
jgi:hypothetical protein